MSPEMLFGLLWKSLLQTLQMVAVSGLAGAAIGLPIGVFLATSGKGELFPAPKLNYVIGLIVNAARSTPFIILVVAIIPFTRLIAGPMDYHLGGFRAVPRALFKPRNVAPNVLGTRAHMLAMYVCFDNPAPMVADYPIAYEGQAGFDFLKLVPTWWDETRVLVDSIG